MKQEMKELLQEFIERDFTAHEIREVMEVLDDLHEYKHEIELQGRREASERDWIHYEQSLIEARQCLDGYGINRKLEDLI